MAAHDTRLETEASGGGMAPSAQALLQAWEEGRDVSPGERGLVLLRLAAPEVAEADRTDLTVGRRDGLLIGLFQRLFGPTAAAVAACRSCGEHLEFDVALEAIGVAPPHEPPSGYTLAWDGSEIAFRLPSAGDLAALGAQPRGVAVGTAARSLADRCIVAVRDASGSHANAALGDAAAQALDKAIAARVAEDDPQAVVMLTFDCPSCSAQWRAPFDIVEFLWRRLDVFVRSLLRDVHVLASTYGWSERDIVALTPWRRRHYIALIGA